MQDTQFRTYVEEQTFIDDLDRLLPQYPNIELIRDAIGWELCRRPYAGELIPGEQYVRVFLSYSVWNTPTFRVLYKYNEAKDPRIFLFSISPVNGSDDW